MDEQAFEGWAIAELAVFDAPQRCVCGHTSLTHFALNGRLGDCACCRCYEWQPPGIDGSPDDD